MDETGKFRKTYALLRRLGAINGANISGELLDQVMYNFEALPPLGKEYWWFLLLGQDRRQMMVMVFRKSGRSMRFNGREFALKKIDPNKFQAVTTGWVYHGGKIHDLGDANPVVSINPKEKVMVSEIAGREFILKGGFPEYEMRIEGLVRLRMTEGNFLENKCAYGVFIPPLGAGWIGVYSKVEGELFGEEFNGTAHLQKVVGVVPYGSFHWARVVFQNSSVVSFFCLKAGRDLKSYFHESMHFYDKEAKKHIEFDRPKLRISIDGNKNPTWIVEGRDRDNELRMVLEVYAEKSYTLSGGGSQTYMEYAVRPIEFSFRNKDRTVTLDDLGDGVGTFEDAYTSLF